VVGFVASYDCITAPLAAPPRGRPVFWAYPIGSATRLLLQERRGSKTTGLRGSGAAQQHRQAGVGVGAVVCSSSVQDFFNRVNVLRQ
jgi:hypothetical protein